MQAHPSKPRHGWRALLGEVGVIVIGVCIALAAEQAIEALHHREEIADAKATLRDELSFNKGALLFTARNRQCMLDNTELLLAAIEADDVAAVRRFALLDQSSPFFARFAASRTQAWEVVNASGFLAFMSPDEKLAYANAYTAVELERRFRVMATDQMAELHARASIYDGSPGAKAQLLFLAASIREFLIGRAAYSSIGQVLDPVTGAGIVNIETAPGAGSCDRKTKL